MSYLNSSTMSQEDFFHKLFSNGKDESQPLLSDEDETNVARVVFNIGTNYSVKDDNALKKDSNKDEFDKTVEDQNFGLNLEKARRNLRTLSDLFDRANKARGCFLENISAFKKCRLRTIQNMREIEDSIYTDSLNGNILKIVGGCTGVVGSKWVLFLDREIWYKISFGLNPLFRDRLAVIQNQQSCDSSRKCV